MKSTSMKKFCTWTPETGYQPAPTLIRTWTKDGWVTRPSSQEDDKRHAKLSKCYEPARREVESLSISHFSVIDNVTEAIQAGIPGTEIDKLPNSTKALYQDTERFFMVNNAVLMSESPEEAADSNDYGTFKEDADVVSEEMKKLEDCGLVIWQDNLDKEEIKNALYEEQIRQRNVIIDEYTGLIEEAEENGDYALADVYAVHCVEEIGMIPDEKQIAYSLNSKFTGKGYSAPKRKFKLVERRFENSFSHYADARKKLFDELFHEMAFCKTKINVWGKPENHPDGTVTFHGGIMNKLRPLYNEDKTLREQWGKDAKEEAEKAFARKWRADFEEEVKKTGHSTKDEESLRQNIYFRFIRTARPEEYKVLDNGKIDVTYGRKASFWDQDKQKAFCNLHLTYEQWSAIYKMKDIVLNRIKLNKETTDDQDLALAELRGKFREITSLDDLKDYVRWAKHRTWIKKVSSDSKSVKKVVKLADGTEKKTWATHRLYRQTYEFELSLIDRISINNEIKWEAAVREKGRKLIAATKGEN